MKAKTKTPPAQRARKVRRIQISKANVRQLAASYVVFCCWCDQSDERTRIAVHNDLKQAIKVFDNIGSYWYKINADSLLEMSGNVALQVVNNTQQARKFVNWSP